MTALGTMFSALAQLSPAQWVQICFGLASCFILSITIAPAAERNILLNYGARRDQDATTNEGRHNSKSTAPPAKVDAPPPPLQADSIAQTLRKVTSLGQVPHAWFFTYYAFYILCAEVWSVHYFMDGPNLLEMLTNRQVAVARDAPSMTGAQVVIVWILMFAQAWRRLYECFAVMQPSASTMWFVHWLVGLGYYLGVSVATWVEGSAALVHHRLFEDFTDEARIKTAIALPLFVYGWTRQHQCHKQLAGLKKYSLPDAGLFRSLVCPHYTCECLVYFALAVIGAPAGQWWNRTLLSVLLFVAVNLGVTAYGTRSWYIEKFGPERVVGKWIMIPFVY